MHGPADHRRDQGIHLQPLLRTVPSRELAPFTHPFVSLRDQGPQAHRAISLFLVKTSTVRIGASLDTGVIDPRLRVFGIKGLRIVDASVFPNQISGHPAAVVAAVAEKAADIIKADSTEA